MLRGWKRFDKPGSALVGFANVALPIGPAWLLVDDCPITISAGKAGVTWPSRPIVTPQGTLARIPGTSKTRYVAVLRWGDRDTSTRFSAAVVRLVRAADPSAFTDREGGQPPATSTGSPRGSDIAWLVDGLGRRDGRRRPAITSPGAGLLFRFQHDRRDR